MKIFKRFTLLTTSLSTYAALALLQANSILASSDMLNRGTNSDGEVITDLADPNSAYGLLGSLISVLMYIIIIGGAVTAFVFFIIGAIQWGTAGSGEGAASARKTMLYAAAGLVAVALVYVVMLFFNSILPSASSCNSSVDPGCAPN